MTRLLYHPVLHLLAALMLIFSSCKKSEETPATAPTGVTTTVQTNVLGTSATVGGQVGATGGSTITSFGICYSSTRITPTTDDLIAVASGNPLNPFTLTLTGLSQATRYYYVAFATNEKGTTYGSVMQFTTQVLPLPSLITDMPGAASILDTAVQVSGTVTDDAGLTLTARGFCWKLASASGDPTTADNKVTSGSGSGSFSATIGGLNPVFTYKVRAYATTGNGTAYGNTIQFETKPGVPKVITGAAIRIGKDSATIPLTIASANGALTRRFGVLISLTANPTDTTDGPYVAKGDASGGAGSSYGRFSTLAPNTTYHARAFCTNAAGIGYGNDVTFTTLP